MQTKQNIGIPVALVHSWFHLTADEQKAILIVIILFLIGMGVRTWHRPQQTDGAGSRPDEITQWTAPAEPRHEGRISNEH